MKLFGIVALATLSTGQEEIADEACVHDGLVVPCPNEFAPRGTMNTGPSTGRRPDDREGVRRYGDLAEMSLKHWKKQGNGREWDERKYWGYGCHCFMLGDRPMTEMGHGTPVDGLDSACHKWKLCQRCAREKHGDTCIGEFVKYTWKFSGQLQTFVMLNEAGTCERELGECDMKFVIDTHANKDFYEEENNVFYGNFDKSDQNSCPRSSNTPVDHECCGGHSSAWIWMATNRQQCCKNPANNQIQHVASIDSPCVF